MYKSAVKVHEKVQRKQNLPMQTTRRAFQNSLSSRELETRIGETCLSNPCQYVSTIKMCFPGSICIPF